MIKSVICDPNFEGLDLGCIEADFRNQILVGKLLTRSIRLTFLCTAPLAKFQQIFVKLFANFANISKEIRKILHFKMRFSSRFSQIFTKIAQIFTDLLENAELHYNSPNFCRFFGKKAKFSGHENGQKSDSVIHIPSRL